jgi:hypothetical protein
MLYIELSLPEVGSKRAELTSGGYTARLPGSVDLKKFPGPEDGWVPTFANG